MHEPDPKIAHLHDLIRSEQTACQTVNSGRGVKQVTAFAVFRREHGVDVLESLHLSETEAERVAVERNAAEHGAIAERKRGRPRKTQILEDEMRRPGT